MQRLLQTAIEQFHDLDAVIMLSLSEKLLLTPLLTNRSIVNCQLSIVNWLEHDKVGRWLEKSPWLPKLKDLSNKVTTIVVSELSKKIYVGLGWPEEKVIAIPNGIDPTRFSSKEDYKLQATSYPSRLGRAETDKLHIGCVSRLTHDKGVDLLIEAVKEIPDVHLTIVGTGREEKLISQSANTSTPLSTGKLISLVPHVKNLGNFYNSIDLLVLPSREHDPFGLVAAEAMMLGVPVVVTDACGIADYLENGKDAVVVKAGSVQALKEGITMLLSSEEKRREIGQKGEEIAMEKFTVEGMVDKYQELLSK